jgi:hypothetical protein
MATTETLTAQMTVKISPNDQGNPPGKLADAELHFLGGPLEGLKLIGFAIWERRGGYVIQLAADGSRGAGADFFKRPVR